MLWYNVNENNVKRWTLYMHLYVLCTHKYTSTPYTHHTNISIYSIYIHVHSTHICRITMCMYFLRNVSKQRMVNMRKSTLTTTPYPDFSTFHVNRLCWKEFMLRKSWNSVYWQLLELLWVALANSAYYTNLSLRFGVLIDMHLQIY